MSEQDRQDRIDETLALLGRMTPAALAANRDELFFRAGEASARGELAALPAWRHRIWPAIAATLALIAAGLGYSLANQQSEVQIVYVERPSVQPTNQAADGATEAPSSVSPSVDASVAGIAAQYSRTIIPLGTRIDIIHPQDWGALSDAFIQQLRLQQERNDATHSARLAAVSDDGAEALFDNKSPQRPRTYLELRDALQAL